MSDVESGSVCQETPCQQSRNSQEKQSFLGEGGRVMTPSAQVCMARFPTFVLGVPFLGVSLSFQEP